MTGARDVRTRLSGLPASLYVYSYTAGRMRPRQVAGMGERFVRQLLIPRLPFDFDGWYERNVPDELEIRPEPLRENTAILRASLSEERGRAFRRRARAAADGEVTLMNRRFTVATGTGVDWYADGFDDLPLLWRLKLYAFEPLTWLLGFEVDDEETEPIERTFEGWIDSWIDDVKVGRLNYLRRAWTPYFVSLRILNWCRFLATGVQDETKSDGAFVRELFKNACYLSNHVEHDVGGNHLIDNGAGLVAAGVLFGDEGTRFLEAGLSVLDEAAGSQFLEDGFHFERSSMYHVQTLTRYLTVRDLLTRLGTSVPESIERVARDGAAFLEFIRPPDDELPLLNDAVHGQTLSLLECVDYADATGLDAAGGGASSAPPGPVRRPDEGVENVSGLGWLDTAGGRMLVDGGPVGPPHLPGHSHSDLLSYLLWLDDGQVVADTGTFDYERRSRRQYARGVRGHNTVQVGEVEPIPLAGRYLMGPRPVPTVRWQRGDVDLFEGHYRARPGFGTGYDHHRAVFAGDRWWLVWDRVTSPGDDAVRSRIHLHPEVRTSRDGTGTVHLGFGGPPSEPGGLWVHRLGGARLESAEGPYFPEFGKEISREVLSVERPARPSAPTGFGYALTLDPVDSPTVELGERGNVTAFVVGDTRYDLPRLRLP